MEKPNPQNIMAEFLVLKDKRRATWDKMAEKCTRYVFGDQWSAEEKAQIKGEPVKHNLILPAVDLILGHFLNNRGDVVAKPVDEYGDDELADIITAVMKNIENINRIEDQDKQQFLKGIITGFGVKELWLDTEEDYKGIIRCQTKSGDDYFRDTDSRQYDYTDARFLFKTLWMTKEDVKRTYGKAIADKISFDPEAKDAEGISGGKETAASTWSGNSNDYGNVGDAKNEFSDETIQNMFRNGYDVNKKLIRLVEKYYKVWEEKKIIYDPDSQQFVDFEKIPKELQELFTDKVIYKTVPHIHLTSVLGDGILAEDIPLKAKEFYQLFNFYYPYWLDGKYMGIVENLLSPQDETNHRHSAAVKILSSIAKTGFMYEEDAISDEEAVGLEDTLSRPGFVQKLEAGAISQGKIKEFQGHPDIPPSLTQQIQMEEGEIKYISGANDAIQGIAPRSQSGSAKKSDIDQSAVRLTPIIDNFKESRILTGKAIIWWIQNYYTEERVIRVIGQNPQDTGEALTINKQTVAGIFNDMTIGNYDVVLDFEGKTKSERERTYWQLIEMQRGLPPEYSPILAKHQLKFMNLPEAQEIQAEFEQQQQMQQQMQQQQMMGGMIPGGGGQPQYAPRPSRGARRMPGKMAG